jgi:hypothetical protein
VEEHLRLISGVLCLPSGDPAPIMASGRVRFGATAASAPRVVWRLHYGRDHHGRIRFKDGDPTNLRPENLY